MKRCTTRRIIKRLLVLKCIGGHVKYHREGNAYQHSILVWRAARKIFKGNKTMQIVALLHDIGKIETSVRNGKGDWSYPNHAKVGGEILDKFIPRDHPHFEEIRWYIQNHIKPLFWKSVDDAQKVAKDMPEGCTIQNLAKLALCDLQGSHAVKEVDNSKLIHLLKKIAA